MSSDSDERCKKLLAGAKLRMTKQRKAVLSVLFRAESPVTQHHISDELGKDAPDKVTIYRVLQTLVDAGVVHKAFLSERTWHFELAHNCGEHQCHPHFTCTCCGTTHCMHNVNLPMVKSHRGFKIDHQKVQLEGLCPKCSGSDNKQL